jgi:hypothetical protein
MKKRLILLGLGLAVVGTGMVINKLRKRNNEEETIETEEAMDVEIVEEVIENEVEEIVVDNDEEIEILDCEENYVPKHEKIYKLNNKIINKLQKKINTLLIKNKLLENIDLNDYIVTTNIPYFIRTDEQNRKMKKMQNKMKIKLFVRINKMTINRCHVLILGFICENLIKINNKL